MKEKVWELVKEMVDARTKNVRREDWEEWLDDIVDEMETLALMVEQRGGV